MRRVLILAAHGVRDDPQVNATLGDLAARVAEQVNYDAVRIAFHQGTPAYATVMDACPASSYVVVPIMTSGGYYATYVLPRELRRNRQYAESSVRITMPIGTHPQLATHFIRRIEALADEHRAALRDTTVAVVGHGTGRHPDSRRATEALTAHLARRLPARDVRAAFIDDEPGVHTLPARVRTSTVIVLPLLISEGPHTRVDVPAAFGMRAPVEPPSAQEIAGRRWIYDQPLAAHAELADLVLDLAREPAAAPVIRLGTRASRLARFQAHLVADRLRAARITVEAVPISTQGDRDQQRAIEALPGDAPFVADLEHALRAGDIDLAVHSLKDMPLLPREGLSVVAVLPRGRAGEALVSRSGLPLAELPAGAVVGTSSTRRVAQLRRARPDLRSAILRGPVDKRLADLRAGRFDAVIVAAAALERLGCLDVATELLSEDTFLPAPAQGAIALQIREGERDLAQRLQVLDDRATRIATDIERSIAAALDGRGSGVVAALARAGVRHAVVAHWLTPDGVTCHAVRASHEDGRALVRLVTTQLNEALAPITGAAR